MTEKHTPLYTRISWVIPWRVLRDALGEALIKAGNIQAKQEAASHVLLRLQRLVGHELNTLVCILDNGDIHLWDGDCYSEDDRGIRGCHYGWSGVTSIQHGNKVPRPRVGKCLISCEEMDTAIPPEGKGNWTWVLWEPDMDAESGKVPCDD